MEHITSLCTFLNSNAQLAGTLPKYLAYLPKLTEIKFNNAMGHFGTIPADFGNLKTMRRMLIEHNRFSGRFPETLRWVAMILLMDPNIGRTWKPVIVILEPQCTIWAPMMPTTQYYYLFYLCCIYVCSLHTCPEGATSRIAPCSVLLSLQPKTHFCRNLELITEFKIADNDFEGDLGPIATQSLMVVSTYGNPKLCGMVPKMVRFSQNYNPANTNLGYPCPDGPGVRQPGF
jgi:hypothetical protein